MNIDLDDYSKSIDLDRTLSCGQVFRWAKLNGWWCGVLGDSIIKIRQGEDRLEVLSSNSIPRIMIASYLRLDDDLSAIVKELCKDKTFRRIVARVRGIRILRQDPWECLVSYVCSRNCRIAMIRKVLNTLSCRFGQKVVWDGYIDYSFPTAEDVARAKLEDLIRCGLRYGRRQALELKEMSRLVCEGVIDFHKLRKMPYDEAKSTLMSYDHGVGNKVSDCILLFSLEKLEAFPVDVWIARALAQLYHFQLGRRFAKRIRDGRRLTVRDYKILSEFGRTHFGRYAGYAQEYLYYWRRLQQNVCTSEQAASPRWLQDD
jgi:N-glycosylase/DNA lyase